MSLWGYWFVLCEHLFQGCTVVGVIELMATILTMCTIVTIGSIPYYIVRGRRK